MNEPKIWLGSFITGTAVIYSFLYVEIVWKNVSIKKLKLWSFMAGFKAATFQNIHVSVLVKLCAKKGKKYLEAHNMLCEKMLSFSEFKSFWNSLNLDAWHACGQIYTCIFNSHKC